MTTPSSRPSNSTPDHTPQSSHIIPSYEDSLSSQPPLPPSIDIACLPSPPTNVPSTELIDETLHKNSVGPLSIRTLNMVHGDAPNIPPIYPSFTPPPCKNMTQFESLNLHRIFSCRIFRNQNHLTAATNISLVNSGLLPSTIGSFATIANPP